MDSGKDRRRAWQSVLVLYLKPGGSKRGNGKSWILSFSGKMISSIIGMKSQNALAL
jgi:hypothetical protein